MKIIEAPTVEQELTIDRSKPIVVFSPWPFKDSHIDLDPSVMYINSAGRATNVAVGERKCYTLWCRHLNGGDNTLVPLSNGCYAVCSEATAKRLASGELGLS